MTATETAAQQIRTAYSVLASAPGAPVGMLALRSQIDLDDQALAAGLVHLAATDASQVFVEVEPKRRNLTDADRAAAVRIGGQDMNLITII